jgi:hypothetical protein
MGAYLPQKSGLAPPLERQYISVQRHVSFYILKRSPDSFVWATPTLLRSEPNLFNEENSLRGANTVGVSNPARVKAREVWHDWGIFNFKYSNTTELYGVSNRIQCPVQINTALNREGVELLFDQSYQFEVTTVPLGLHYITS